MKPKAVDNKNTETERELKRKQKAITALALSIFIKIDINDKNALKKATREYNREVKKIYVNSDVISKEIKDNVFRGMKQVDKLVSIKSDVIALKYEKPIIRLTRDVTNTVNKSYRKSSVMFKQRVDKQLKEVVKGNKTMKQAAKDFEKEMKLKGISKVRAGKSARRYDTRYWAEMNIRTEQNKILLNANKDYLHANDYQAIVKISRHTNMTPREHCKDFEDKYINLDGEGGMVTDINGNTIEVIGISDTTMHLPAGILQINCRHSSFPIMADKMVLD